MKKILTYLAGLLFLTGTLVSCPAVGNQVLAAVQVKSGDSQTAVVGTELPTAISVHAVDESGAPIAGQIVNFKVTHGGGSVFAGSALTDGNGNASERWTLGPLVGIQKLEIRVVNSAGVAILFATIQATAIAGAPASIVNDSGDGQFAELGRVLASPVAIVVKDQFGNPTAGVELTFAAQNGGSVSPATALTDSEGKTSTIWTLGVAQLGLQTMKVFVSASPSVLFNVSATAIETIPFTITIVGGNQQAVTQHVPLLEPLRVRVTDHLGNPKSGVYVEFFSSPGYGYIEGTNYFMTDANGIVEWNGTIHSSGAQRVTARARDLTQPQPLFEIAPVEFSFNVIAGSPFDGLFELSRFEDNMEIVKFQFVFRNGQIPPPVPSNGPQYRRGGIDSVTGSVSIRETDTGASGIDYTGTFIKSSDGIVTGSGTWRPFQCIECPSKGTWTVIKIHD
jgi:Bacterial Ig-like domain (group 1)